MMEELLEDALKHRRNIEIKKHFNEIVSTYLTKQSIEHTKLERSVQLPLKMKHITSRCVLSITYVQTYDDDWAYELLPIAETDTVNRFGMKHEYLDRFMRKTKCFTDIPGLITEIEQSE